MYIRSIEPVNTAASSRPGSFTTTVEGQPSPAHSTRYTAPITPRPAPISFALMLLIGCPVTSANHSAVTSSMFCGMLGIPTVLQETQQRGLRDRVVAVARAELAVHVRQMGLHGRGRDEQRRADLL